MADTAPKPARRNRGPRKDYKRDVEATIMFCKIAIQTCEEFRDQEVRKDVFDAQIRAYTRVLKCLGITLPVAGEQ